VALYPTPGVFVVLCLLMSAQPSHAVFHVDTGLVGLWVAMAEIDPTETLSRRFPGQWLGLSGEIVNGGLGGVGFGFAETL
jgi:hypothetical protein